jgi:hypothetical protein
MNRTFIVCVLLLSEISFADNNSKDQCRKNAVILIDKRIDEIRSVVGECNTKEECTFYSVGSGLHVNRKFYQARRACYSGINSAADELCTFGSIKKDGGAVSVGFGMVWQPAKRPYDYDCVNKQCIPLYDEMKPTRKFKIPEYNGSISELDKKCNDEFKQYLNNNLLP